MNRGKVHPVPISKQVTAQVDDLGRIDAVPEGFKITSRHDDILHDSDWIAGVDHEEKQEEENENDNENEDDCIDCYADNEELVDVWKKELDMPFPPTKSHCL